MQKITREISHWIWQEMIKACQSNPLLINMDSIAQVEMVHVLQEILEGCTENEDAKSH